MAKPKYPKANLSIVSNKDGLLVLSTYGTKSAPGSKLRSWIIEWGDNNVQQGSGNPPSELQHEYEISGKYDISFIVQDHNSYSDGFGMSPFILKNPPQPPPSGNVLSQSDLIYDGCFGIPLTGYGPTTNIDFAWAAMTGRVVGGQTRIFMLSSHSTGGFLYEMIPPSSLATNPSQLGNNSNFRATISRDWGNIYGEDPVTGNVKRQNGPGNLCDVDGHILFLNGKLYWTFWASYNVTDFNDRCIGLSELNDTTGVATRRGPWRVGNGTRNKSKFCGGHITEIPTAFANTYLGGKKIHLGNQTSSGVATAPMGLTFFAMDDVNPLTPESNIAVDTDVALTPQEYIAYRIDSLQPITIENWVRRICSYSDPGNCSTASAFTPVGSTQVPVADTALYCGADSAIGALPGFFNAYIGPFANFFNFQYSGKSTTSGPGFLTGVPATGTGSLPRDINSGEQISLGKYDNARGGTTFEPTPYFGPNFIGGDFSVFWDYVTGACWINSPTGKQGVLLLGGVADSIPGGGYGSDDRTHVIYTANPTCPHGQDFSAILQGTGPVSRTTVMVGWIYDQNDMIRIIQGSLIQPNLIPAHYFRWNSIASGIDLQPVRGGGLKQAWYDSVHSKLYISEQNRDLSFGGPTLNLVHRFSVQ